MRRNIAVLARHIFETLKEKKEKEDPTITFTQRRFGQELQKTSTGEKLFIKNLGKFNEGYITHLLNGAIPEKDQKSVLMALWQIGENENQNLVEEQKLPIIEVDAIPTQLYLRYRKELATEFGAFADYIPRDLPAIGARCATAFRGLWRLFLVSASPGVKDRVVHTNVAFFHEADEGDPRAYGLMIGPQKTRWVVACSLCGNHHVYLLWNDANSGLTSLTISGLPEMTDDGAYKIVGLSTFREPRESPGDLEQQRPQVMSTLAFGTSCTLDTCFVGDKLNPLEVLGDKKKRSLKIPLNARAKATISLLNKRWKFPITSERVIFQ